MSDAYNQFYQFTSESTRDKMKTKMICVVESLLNEEDLRATSSSHKTEGAAKQDDFLFKQSKDKKESAAKLVKEFLDASPQTHDNASYVKHEALKRVFIKMNTRALQSKKCFRLEKTF